MWQYPSSHHLQCGGFFQRFMFSLFSRIIFCPKHKVEFRVKLKICQFKWDYDKVEIQMFWSLQVTRDALCRCKKVSAFPEKLVCKDRPMSYKNAQYTRYYLHLFSLSKPQFLTARSLGKARARYLFQWMLFEKGQNFKSRRPFRPDLCPVLLVNHWRKILVCISPFFQSFSITGHLAPVMVGAKIAPIGEREKLFTSA